ncbi:alpha-L-glutamate ligase [Kitasatospora sp. NPDC049285]|uniref:ATP-grasp domain-containing protein n=1 Tax=Kitasatospora sp. NPDC049285 TaxID=3157096 RepID=UPI0034300D4F
MRRLRIVVLARDTEHPLLTETLDLLAADGHVRVDAGEPADLVLLKARTADALEVAAEYEEMGVPVLNSVAATAFCQDRVAMEQRARAHRLPFAPTLAAGAIEELPWHEPVVVKSRRSRRGDLVARVDSADAWQALARERAGEQVITQRVVPGDGWDRKVWVVGGRIFGEQRRSELAATAGGEAVRRDWTPGAEETELAFMAGWAFGLDVFGVDLLPTPDGPVIIDVNAFPGVRHQPGAPRALADLALRTTVLLVGA